MKRSFKRGDYFLCPYSGSRLYNLVRLIKPFGSLGDSRGGHWCVTHPNLNRHNSYTINVDNLRRCSPSLAKRIMNPKAKRA